MSLRMLVLISENFPNRQNAISFYQSRKPTKSALHENYNFVFVVFILFSSII